MRVFKNKGSALLTALLFSFVLMVIVSALAYNYRVSMLTIDSLVKDELNVNVDEGYLNDVFVSNNLNNDIDETVGDFTFDTDLDSVSPGFQFKHTNALLYQADPYVVSHSFTHHFITNGITEYVKKLIFNSLPADTYVSYNEDIRPLNVPFVNVDGMTGDLATYKLSDGSILDSERGYTGSISKNGSNLDITAVGTSTSVGVPADLSSTDYKFSIGWNLKDGLWNLFLAAYNTSKVYTSSTSLRNLVDNSSQAQTDLNNWKQIASLPNGSSIPSGSVVLTKWIHDADDEVPKPVILRKQERTEGSGTYDLVIYRTTFNSTTGVYTVKTPAKVEATDDFDITKVFMVVPDNNLNLGSLDAKRPLIFFQDDGYTKVFQFNTHNADGVVSLGNLGGSIFGGDLVQAEPVLVKKNELQSYIIYYDDNYYYTHTYAAGSLNTTAIISQGVSGTIEKLIPKFGALFIVTSSDIYIYDFDYTSSVLVNKITSSNSKAQILRDDNGDIYAMPNGLTCTIAGNCNANNRLYIRDEGNCTNYTGGCDKIDALNNITPYLGLIYNSRLQ